MGRWEGCRPPWGQKTWAGVWSLTRSGLGTSGSHCLESVSSTVERGPSHAPHSLVMIITYNNLQSHLLPLRAGTLPLPPAPLGPCPAQSTCSVTCHSQFFLRTMLRGSLLLKQANRRGQSSEPVRPAVTLQLGRGGGDWGVRKTWWGTGSKLGHDPPLF